MNVMLSTTTSIIVVILLLVIYLYFRCNTQRRFRWSMNDSSHLTNAIKDILSKNYVTNGYDEYACNIRFMSGYNHVETELKNTENYKYNYISGIRGMDNIVGKDYLYQVLKKYYSHELLMKLVPCTYILNDITDQNRLLITDQNNKIFIFKKNIQRQEGLLLLKRKDITSDKLKQLIKQDYVIAQEYLDNPLIIDNRKVNIRVYMLLTILNGYMKVYIYDDGFVYYSQDKYDKNNTSKETAITTGLQKDRTVYERNPLTIKDLKKYINDTGILNYNIESLLRSIMKGVSKSMGGHKGSLNFSLFGCDIQPDPNLDVKLIEINKSPSLSPKDERDAQLKYKLQEDMLMTLGIIPNRNSNGFIRI